MMMFEENDKVASLTFQTMFDGELTLYVDAEKAPILINALLRAKPTWSFLTMTIHKNENTEAK